MYKQQRYELVESLQLKGITDELLLQAISKVEREKFISAVMKPNSYKDIALPIGHGQTISQPYTIAIMTQALEIKKGDKVLEIGTGSGYQAAILAEMGAKVYTIERQRELFLKAQKTLSSLGYSVYFFLGDGYEGKPHFGPFDGILITAAAKEIPDALLKQLKTGGKLVIPVGDSSSQVMTLVKKTGEDSFDYSSHGCYVFVPMLRGIVKEK